MQKDQRESEMDNVDLDYTKSLIDPKRNSDLDKLPFEQKMISNLNFLAENEEEPDA